ncbi:hypothetical protein K503DRAFT_769778 [Rhizopogon vinicolor AM-OR11-026]|uniref:Uncharacterized protein n=1 Tax=Rhizopogon vinicolor AM-OR11-026 TaxID=1314800 RepID=A0A1B7N2J2_9AGAM|nr:hypothetical protein K503DRAFT_769778 [Rhizopogon vinicolor AM-OR11-026]
MVRGGFWLSMRMVKAVRTGECESREGEEDEAQPYYALHYVSREDWRRKMSVREAGKHKYALDANSQFFISTFFFVRLFCSPLSLLCLRLRLRLTCLFSR